MFATGYNFYRSANKTLIFIYIFAATRKKLRINANRSRKMFTFQWAFFYSITQFKVSKLHIKTKVIELSHGEVASMSVYYIKVNKQFIQLVFSAGRIQGCLLLKVLTFIPVSSAGLRLTHQLDHLFLPRHRYEVEFLQKLGLVRDLKQKIKLNFIYKEPFIRKRCRR